jgi:hypothetical protein
MTRNVAPSSQRNSKPSEQQSVLLHTDPLVEISASAQDEVTVNNDLFTAFGTGTAAPAGAARRGRARGAGVSLGQM